MVADSSPACAWGGSSGQVHDGDATTLTAATGCTTCADVFELTDWAECTGKTIRAVMMGAVSRKSGGTSQTFKMYLRIGGVDYSVKSISPSSASSYFDSGMANRVTTNPATSAAWTCSDLNSLQLKIDERSRRDGQHPRYSGRGRRHLRS